MPRHVDHAVRRREITDAAIRILARGGTQTLTLRTLADELGGSITLVTHFFATRGELFDAIVDDLLAGYDETIGEIEDGAGPLDRLKILLTWMLPTDPEDVRAETGRIALISHRDEHESIRRFFDRMEERMRSLIAAHLQEVEIGIELDVATSYLRAVINGVVLSAVEHPDLWPPARQLEVLGAALSGLTLPSARATATRL